MICQAKAAHLQLGGCQSTGTVIELLWVSGVLGMATSSSPSWKWAFRCWLSTLFGRVKLRMKLPWERTVAVRSLELQEGRSGPPRFLQQKRT